MPIYKHEVTGNEQEFPEDIGDFYIALGIVRKVKGESAADRRTRLLKESEEQKAELGVEESEPVVVPEPKSKSTEKKKEGDK